MKRMITGLAAFVFLFTLGAGLSAAEEKATKEECMAKAKEAAALIKEVGIDEAKVKLGDPNGSFVWKDSYVAIEDFDEVMITHPMVPKMVGKSMKGIKDANGKMFNAEFIQIASGPGEGWVTYMWPKPGSKEPSAKSSYIYRVPGTNFIAIAGIYE